MIQQYCDICEKTTGFIAPGICINCKERKNKEHYNNEKSMFTSLSNEDKLIYIFNEIYELKYKKNTNLGVFG